MSRTRYIARAGVIAAVHAGLTLLTMQAMSVLSWGPVQFRVSEALTILPVFSAAAVPGLVLGTLIANAFNVAVLGPVALLDVVFGTLATALGALWTRRFRDRPPLALAGPVISNALIVPAYLPLMVAGLGLYRVPVLGIDLEGSWPLMYIFGVVTVGIGQATVVYVLGLPVLAAMRRLGLGEVLERD